MFEAQTSSSSAKMHYEKVYMQVKKKLDWSGIRTHAPEEIGALIQRLRPLGHPVLYAAANYKDIFSA